MPQGFGRRGQAGETSRSTPAETQWTGQPVQREATVVSEFRSGKINLVTAPSTPISNFIYGGKQVLKRMGLWI